MGKYIRINKNSVTIKEPTVVVFDGKIFIVDEKKKVNIQSALNNGAYWRSTADGLLLLIQNGEVILVTRRKGGGGYHGKRSGGSGGGSHGGWGKPKHGYDSEIAKIRRTIPVLRNFDQYSKKYAEDLKASENISDAEEKEFADNFKRLVDDSDYAMRVKSSTFAKRLNSGFKNQIQVYEETGQLHSGGYKGPEKRKEWSQKMFGHDGTDGTGHELSGKDYETYGFLTPKDMSITPQADQYGDTVVRFKKNKFKGRVTYTIGDSLKLVECAGDIENPSMAGFSSWYAKVQAKKAKSVTNIKDYAKDVIGDYIELQYHGANPTIDDIESVTFTKRNSKLSMATFRKLKKKGIKIYLKTSSGPIKEIKTEDDVGNELNYPW